MLHHLAGAVAVLPSELRDDKVATAAVSGSIRRLCKARKVCRSMCHSTSSLVHTLQTGAACDITSEAWESFSNADGIRIQPFLDNSTEARDTTPL